ncbi:NADPH-dependent diflavin oxidoreductase 1 [Cucumispora dikerogammari]|nr:NADPH-dependent diflavin oxidoreductase 1 [Cucumispora dikerogammari]
MSLQSTTFRSNEPQTDTQSLSAITSQYNSLVISDESKKQQSSSDTTNIITNNNMNIETHPIFYASQTGNSEHLAILACEYLNNSCASVGNNMNTDIKIEYNVKKPINYIPVSTSTLAISDFIATNPLVLIISTHGDGDFNYSFSKIWYFISYPHTKLIFRNIKFSILGLGDSNYLKYNYAAKKVHNRIVQLGGTSLLGEKKYLADEQHLSGVYTEYSLWVRDLKIVLGNVNVWHYESPNDCVGARNRKKLSRSTLSINKSTVSASVYDFHKTTPASSEHLVSESYPGALNKTFSLDLLSNSPARSSVPVLTDTSVEESCYKSTTGKNTSDGETKYKGIIAKIQHTQIINSNVNYNEILNLRLEIDNIEYYPGMVCSFIPENCNIQEFLKYNLIPMTDAHYIENIMAFLNYNSILQFSSLEKLYLFVKNCRTFHFNDLNRQEIVLNKLRELSEDYNLYYSFIKKQRISLFGLLKEFKVYVNYEFILKNCYNERARYYTLPRIDKDINNKSQLFELTITLLKSSTTKTDTNTTEYLKSLKKGNNINIGIHDSLLYFSKNKILVFCTGSGIAVGRSIWNYFGGKKEIVVYYGYRFEEEGRFFEKEIVNILGLKVIFCCSRGDVRVINNIGNTNKNNQRVSPRIEARELISQTHYTLLTASSDKPNSVTTVSSNESSSQNRHYIQNIFTFHFTDEITEYDIVVGGSSKLIKEIRRTLNLKYKKDIPFMSETW